MFSYHGSMPQVKWCKNPIGKNPPLGGFFVENGRQECPPRSWRWMEDDYLLKNWVTFKFHPLIFPKTNMVHLKMGAPWKRRFLLETIISRFYVNFWGCNFPGCSWLAGTQGANTLGPDTFCFSCTKWNCPASSTERLMSVHGIRISAQWERNITRGNLTFRMWVNTP